MNSSEFSQKVCGLLRQLWADQGGLDLMAVVLAHKLPDGRAFSTQQVVVIMPDEAPQTLEDKEKFASGLRSTVADMDADMVAVVAEVWAVEHKLRDGESVDTVLSDVEAPSEHPDRVEGVMLSVESKGSTRSFMATIVTDGDSRKLSSFEEVPLARLEGRLTNFLPAEFLN